MFRINPRKKTVTYIGKESLNRFYNGGNVFSLSKVNRNLTPNKKLVGSTWRMDTEDGELYFKTSTEVIARDNKNSEQSVLYVCIGNMISIKGGDNLSSENMIGNIINGNEVTLCREGLDPQQRGDRCVTIYKQ